MVGHLGLQLTGPFFISYFCLFSGFASPQSFPQLETNSASFLHMLWVISFEASFVAAFHLLQYYRMLANVYCVVIMGTLQKNTVSWIHRWTKRDFQQWDYFDRTIVFRHVKGILWLLLLQIITSSCRFYCGHECFLWLFAYLMLFAVVLYGEGQRVIDV